MGSRVRILLYIVLLAMSGCAGMGPTPSISEEKQGIGSFISGAERGVAIQGYDTVAYWTEQSAVKGKPEFSTEWAGTAWFFVSPENLARFEEEPEKYAPKYGGHCSYSVALNGTARGSGEAWTIRGNELYLNGSKQVRKRWLGANTNQLIRQANRNWPAIKQALLGK